MSADGRARGQLQSRPVETILDSVRAVETTEALTGPYCAVLLGDFGANEIKVERPGVGDQSRG
jgi:crotonobetainyl-CoA:carnitine CoA-transferase CaiB-like acyl-CoA transferase